MDLWPMELAPVGDDNDHGGETMLTDKEVRKLAKTHARRVMGKEPLPTTIVVTIGRNARATVAGQPNGVGQLPMSSDEWRRFRTRVVERLTYDEGVIYFAGEGTGYSPEWGEEKAYTVVVGYTDWQDWQRKELLRALRILAVAFGQDAIAMTEGPTTFALGAES